jgi:hypothetical protein
MQSVNWSVVAAYAKGIWAVGGPLLGVIVGAYIANRNQRQHWISDCKKEEYRELLAVMSKAMTASFVDRSISLKDVFSDEKVPPTMRKNVVDVIEVIQTRIFISPVIAKLDVLSRWGTALKNSMVGEAADTDFAHTVGKLLDDIRNAAREDIGT